MTTKENNNCVTQDKRVIEKIVCNLTLFDDDLMSRVLIRILKLQNCYCELF